jgi:hypothetical protein
MPTKGDENASGATASDVTPPARAEQKKATPVAKVNLSAHALAPDLDAIRRFIVDMIARGAIAELVTSVLALLQRMREINTELMTRIATTSRKRPPSETLHRLQIELPLMFGTVANDAAVASSSTELEGPPAPPVAPPIPPLPAKKREKKHRHGRPKLPDHLERIPGAILRVPEEQRLCPTCKRPTKTLGFKTTEKLTVKPCEYVVEQLKRETCSCGQCHAYIVTAPKADEVVDRGLLGNELLVQALVDHYDDDWSSLWWVRISGRGRVIEHGSAREEAVDLLVAKYCQYREHRPTGPVLLIEIARISSWQATTS